MVATHRLALKGSRGTCCSHAPAAKPAQAAPDQGPAHMSMPERVRDAHLTAGSVHGLQMLPSKPKLAQAPCLVLSPGSAGDSTCHLALRL